MIEHLGIWLPDNESHLQAEMDKRPLVDGKGTYQLHKIEMVLKHTPGRRTAIDVGGHCGMWSRILAKEFAWVEAFEPIPEHVECFERNVLAENVRLHTCALGAEEDALQMLRYPGNSGHTHAVTVGVCTDVVRQRTLDSFALTEVDLIKIDCEGWELNVLRGARETLDRWRPTLIVEQKAGNGSRYGYDDRAAIPWLENLGAKMVAQKAGDYVFVWS
jgi:FkbM family methyltransferase